MKLISHKVLLSYCLLALSLLALTLTAPSAFAKNVNFEVGCPPNNFPPPPAQVKRKIGDSDIWTFTLHATSGTIVKDTVRWNYPTNHTAEEWGTWNVSSDKMTLTWNPPEDGLQDAGVFNVSVGGKISCGSGGNGPLPDFGASQSGEVLARHWKPDPDITGGEMIKPQNQTATPTPQHVMTRVHNELNNPSVPCEVTEATDLDTWEILDEHDTEDDDVTYTWSADGGTFNDPESPGTQKDVVKGRTTQWHPPENIVGTFTLTCTIDDKPKEIKNPPESGRRDDPKIVRTVEIMVVSIHIDPHSLVLEKGEDNKQTYNVSIYPPEAAPYIHFDQVSGSGNVTVTFDGSHLVITGESEGTFTLNATNTETGQTLGAFSGKVLGANDPPPNINDIWPNLDLPPQQPDGPPAIVWSPKTPISGGVIVSPADGKKTVQPGESVSLQVTSASDSDTKYVGSNPPELVPENVSYVWTDQDGKTAQNENDPHGNPGDSERLSVNPDDHTKASWTAPTEEGTYTITCKLVDANTPVPTSEYGSRDDEDIERHFTITVEEKEPDIDTGDDIRACAGHIADGVHEATIHLVATDKETHDPTAATLYLSFEGNKGSEDAKRAKFIVGGEEVEESTVTTNANTGKASITVISSDVISNDIKVKVEWKDSQDNYKEVGSVACDFGEAFSKRNFALDPEQVSFPNDTDDGWWFDTDILLKGDDMTIAKLYLKYSKDGSDVPVDGHTFRISIDDITMNGGGNNVSLENYSRYIYFVNSSGIPLKNGNTIILPKNETTC